MRALAVLTPVAITMPRLAFAALARLATTGTVATPLAAALVARLKLPARTPDIDHHDGLCGSLH